jgi:cell wall-associated NlpC family hydrolase
VRSRHLAAPATPADSQFVRALEYRVGIGFHFGGGRSRSTVYSRRTADVPPSAPRPTRTSRTTWPVSTTSGSGAARRVMSTAEQYIGVPYRYGGTSPRTGFDCSGFVQYVYGSQGVDLPRTSRQMAGAGIAVEPSTRSLAVRRPDAFFSGRSDQSRRDLRGQRSVHPLLFQRKGSSV